MNKQILSLFLIVSLSGLLTGCFTEQKKSLEITVKVPNLTMIPICDSECKEAYQFLEKAANAFSKQYRDADVDINVVCFPIAEENKNIQKKLDTSDTTDILFEGFFNMSTYIHTGRMVPLDDIISDKVRQDLDAVALAQGQINGKTYMLPFNGLQNVLAYNKDLFQQAGLEDYISNQNVIQNWTLKEWEFILSALRKNLPEMTFPMMMYSKNDQGDTHIMTLIRSQGSNFFDERGYFNLSTDEGISGLQWIKDNYDNGYYPTICYNMEILDMSTLFLRGQLGIFFANSTHLNNFTDFTNLNLGFVNFPSKDGNGYATNFLTGFGVFDNGNEEKLKVSKEFIRFIYDNEEWMDYASSGIPASNHIAEKYKNDIFMLENFYQNGKNVVNFTANNPNWRGVRNVFYTHIQNLLSGRRTAAQVASDLDTDCNAAIELGWKNSVLHE